MVALYDSPFQHASNTYLLEINRQAFEAIVPALIESLEFVG